MPDTPELCNVRWTMTHGHFVQMGGFTLMDGDVSKGVLTAEKFQELLSAKNIDLPTITEEEIKDRSKGDGLSATLTVVQTTWFLIQFFLRWRQGLLTTHLEMITFLYHQTMHPQSTQVIPLTLLRQLGTLLHGAK